MSVKIANPRKLHMPAENSNLSESNASQNAWQQLRKELIEIGLTQKWPEALALIGVVHLVASLICHILYRYVQTIAAGPYLLIWSVQLTTNLWIIRKLVGKGWAKSSPLIGILARIWATFLIISFSATSYSEMSADQANNFNWFKPVWASLSCFAWAVTAWIVNPWFVLAAVWTWAGLGDDFLDQRCISDLWCCLVRTTLDHRSDSDPSATQALSCKGT
jgi:hypothetical protein